MMSLKQMREYLKANRWIDVSNFNLELWEPQRRIRMVPMSLESAVKTQQSWDKLAQEAADRKDAEEKAKLPTTPKRTRKKK